MSIAKFSVNNSVLINMIMLVVFIVGIYTMIEIPKEEMPAVDFGSFIIIVMYPGVSSAEMEQLVIQKIEEEIADIDNIDYIESTATEGKAVIYIVFEPDADIDKAENDLRAELDKVRDLPDDANDPYMLRLNMREVDEMCAVVIGGDFSGNAIREISEDLRDGFLDIEHVSKVDIYGTREREIWIEGNAKKLDEYGLSLNDLQNVINMRNMNVPGGTVKFGRAEFIVRTVGEFENKQEINDLVIRMDANGRAIRIQDVATVNDTLEERSIISKLDGNPSVTLFVYKKADGNIIKVMEDIRNYIENFKNDIPGLEATVRNDGSIDVKNSINTLGTSAFIGVILVFISLFVFLGWRNALFAAIGIPFSFLLTFILMQYFDVTMNTLTLFGLVLVLGMIVDDAIIVLENVHRYVEQGMSTKEAAIKGTQEIMWPVIAAVSTTAAAFVPMLMMQGMMGKFMRVFPIVVSLALLASLFESLVILPSHIADFSKPVTPKNKKPHKIHDALVKKYKRAIKFVLRHRFLSVLAVITALILSIMTIVFRLVPFEFFPSQTPKTIILRLQTPIGTNLDVTNEVVSNIEEYIRTMKERKDIEAVVTTVGMMARHHQWDTKTNNAQLRIDLIDIDDMTFSHDQIKNSIRSYLKGLPGLYTYQFAKPSQGPPTGDDIEIRVKGDNLERLEYIGNIIKDELSNIPGVADIEDSFMPGKKEVQINPKHEKLAVYGLTVSQIAGLVRTASYGSTISKYRGKGTDEFDIVLRLQEDQIDDLNNLENLKIRTMNGDLIALKDLAEFEIISGLSQINHRNKKRIITVTGNNSFYQIGNVTKKRTTDEVVQILMGNKITGEKGTLSNFQQRFPGYQLEFGGVAEEQRKSYNSLFLAFGVALLLIFTILAAQFKSYVQPFIVMMTIPFSLIGVIVGLLITGLPASLNSLVAVVALAGVVVNDSLVLVDFVNRERERGVDRWNSLINAGALRLRPIILTSVTTIFGLMPMMLSTAEAVSDWKPMAVSIAFGLAFATVLTLFLIPVIYSLIDSLFGRIGITRFKTHLSYEECVDFDE